jgi:thioredoxin reductase/ferredoxin
MFAWLGRYARWLHTRWPAGTVEKLPVVRGDGTTSLPGVYVTGDLTGIPLLKFALDSGVRAVRAIAADPSLRTGGAEVPDLLDLVVIGAGVSGLAAAIEARRRGLSFRVIESAEPLFTLVNFPRAKPIFTYPADMTPAGELQVHAGTKEALIAELREQVARAAIEATPGRAERVERSGGALSVRLAGGGLLRARRVIVAIGRAGDHRRLGVPGEDLDKVYHRLHDPADFAGRRCLVVGGGDSALETAIALTRAGADVTLSHRGIALIRPKRENVDALERLARDPLAEVAIERPVPGRAGPPGRLAVRPASRVVEIRERDVELAGATGPPEALANDVVFVMIGREAPLDFFRRSGIAIAGEGSAAGRWALGAFLLFCGALYNWKSGGAISDLWYRNHWFPTDLPGRLAAAGGAIAREAADPRTLVGTLAIGASGPSFWYTLAYSAVVVAFGLRRIRRRATPYVTAQTLTLMAVQVFPLFLIPEVILPQLGYHGLLPRGLADALFPTVNYGHGREYWRAYGFILAWPLDVYNVLTREPLWWWIAIGFVQTFVLIPLAIHRFGKGVYCGWICSCGALAETLGDTHRHKMPHGPRWNRMNLLGQGVLALATLLLALRVTGWALPDGSWAERLLDPLAHQYKWTVDVFLAGVLGTGLYFRYSGRIWCRFLCPLAALMHVYARFSRFAIVPEKRKCISCGACTAICHQGIDVMSFANRGAPMRDPQCVRCSACLHACPTGVLRFGQVRGDGTLIGIDSLAASPVLMREDPPAARRGAAGA